MPHATTRLASFLWTEGACLVALWLVGCPRAAEAACGVILLQVDLAAVLRVGALGKIDSALGCPAAQDTGRSAPTDEIQCSRLLRE